MSSGKGLPNNLPYFSASHALEDPTRDPQRPGLAFQDQSMGDPAHRRAKAAHQRNRQTFAQIYPGDTKHLGHRHEELQSILRETHPEQFQQKLKLWAVNLVQAQELQVSGTVLGYLAQVGLTPKLRQEGQDWLAAAQGGGTTQYQVGLIAGNLQSQIYDFPMLFGMGAAGITYKLGKWGTMAASYGRWGRQVGGLGLEMGSSLVGFAMEVPTFTAATKGAQMAMGDDAHWDHFGAEMKSGAWLLGSLKVTGALSKKLIHGLHGVNPATGLPARFGSWYAGTSRAIPQGGMLIGVMGGHEMAARSEGVARPYGFLSWGNLREGLATLIQFNAAGKALPLVMRRSHVLGEELERQAEMLRRFPEFVYPKENGSGRGPQLAYATATNGRGGRVFRPAGPSSRERDQPSPLTGSIWKDGPYKEGGAKGITATPGLRVRAEDLPHLDFTHSAMTADKGPGQNRPPPGKGYGRIRWPFRDGPHRPCAHRDIFPRSLSSPEKADAQGPSAGKSRSQ